MSCYSPLKGWWSRTRNVSGKRSVVFTLKDAWSDLKVEVPCGQCIGCRLDRSRKWAIRCVHEASLHSENSFLTLTYNDSNLPPGGTLVKRHLQLFLKRLRKRYPYRIRFYACGEYGELLSRPHYHVLLFGHNFRDRQLYSVRGGVSLYRSMALETLWEYGYSTVGDVTPKSAAYCARYCLKKINGELKESHYAGLEPEYSVMSRRPGIAREWIESFIGDVYPHDYLVIAGGIECKPPRYYDNIYDLISPDQMRRIRAVRKREAKDDFNNTPERLKVREICQSRKAEQLIRRIENGSTDL